MTGEFTLWLQSSLCNLGTNSFLAIGTRWQLFAKPAKTSSFLPCSCFFLSVLKLGKSWDTSPTRSRRSPVLSSLGPRCSSGHFSIGPALLISYWDCRTPRAMMQREMGDCHPACARTCRAVGARPTSACTGLTLGILARVCGPCGKTFTLQPPLPALLPTPRPRSLRDLSH